MRACGAGPRNLAMMRSELAPGASQSKRGSSDSWPSVFSASSRNSGYIQYREDDFGFRCAADIP
jgi:formylglycine-generating enzyme required for sulfatase activity